MLGEPLTRPVGQGVKTSPSHGENTSSILVLAARNFRSDSEVFCCLNIFLRPRYNNRNSGKRSGKVERVDYRNDILSYFRCLSDRKSADFGLHLENSALSSFHLFRFNFLSLTPASVNISFTHFFICTYPYIIFFLR